ncbi:TPR repeat [Carpediemonas membranifera]|uniref:Outer dynein arm-docking complex subunit 4 n=1 Tax=Carpediemonas membranifera TaxID=201153 RepID=A0A8J6BVL7_9EUKA|nr:TPR repeat [Carpediemonas membranifera]|eukprot:KAG9391536.1 TPR repeat [Carpediemonas membranifera]
MEQGHSAKNLFHIYMSEGDTFIRQEEFERAVTSYSRAITLQEDNRNALLNRSKCYVRLGQYDLALKDAEKSIHNDKKFHTGLMAKAEALYAAGDFEYALVHFHRAHRIRPDIMDYQLGIRKSESAIHRAIGFGEDGVLPIITATNSLNVSMADDTGVTVTIVADGNTPPITPPPTAGGKTTSRRLLGDLFDDHEFLIKLQGEMACKTNKGMAQAVEKGLKFIDSRTEFWRQQQSPVKPTPSRPTTGSVRPPTMSASMGRRGRSLPPQSPARTIGARGSKLIVRVGGSAQPPRAPRTACEPRKKTLSPETVPAVPRSVLARVPPKTASGSSGLSGRVQHARSSSDGNVRIHEIQHHRSTTADESMDTKAPTQPANKTRTSKTALVEGKKYMRATHYVARVMANTTEALETGAPDLALEFAKGLLARLATLEVPDHPRVVADTHSILGTIYLALDRPSPAVGHFKKDLDISLESGFESGHARALRQLANAYVRLDDSEMAIAVTSKLVNPDAISPPSYILGEALLQRGRALYALGRYSEACEDAENACAVLNEPMSPKEPGAGKVDSSVFGFDASMSSSRPELQLDGLCLHGRCLMALGKDAEAVERLQLCVDLARENGDRTAEAAALTNLSVIALSQGEVEKGKRLQHEAVLVSKEVEA